MKLEETFGENIKTRLCLGEDRLISFLNQL